MLLLGVSLTLLNAIVFQRTDIKRKKNHWNFFRKDKSDPIFLENHRGEGSHKYHRDNA